MHYTDIIQDEANRALWEVNNVIRCIPNSLWNKLYCGMPLWKHVYHMLHSLDQWYINPRIYEHPPFHTENLNNLDIPTDTQLTCEELQAYFDNVQHKITAYNQSLTDDLLLQKPENCEWLRFELILAQHRHLHSHMGMIMGFIIADTGLWPRVLGLTKSIPDGEYGTYM